MGRKVTEKRSIEKPGLPKVSGLRLKHLLTL